MNITSFKSVKRIRLQLDTRKARLLDLGRVLFVKHTYHQLSIAEIAKAAKISKGLLYHYFTDKRSFFIETVRFAAREMLELPPSQEAKTPVELLRYTLEAYLTYAEKNAAAYIALIRHGVAIDPEVRVVIAEVRKVFYDRMQDAMKIANPNAEQKLAVWGWLCFVEAICIEWLSSRSSDPVKNNAVDLSQLSLNDLCGFLENQLRASLVAAGFPVNQFNG